MRLRVLLLAVALLVIAAPASAQETTVTYSGRVTAGQFLELTCPEGTQVQIFQATSSTSASASFYRNERRTAVVAVNQPPSGGSVNFVGWNVPKGARYADATLTCEPFPVDKRFTGNFTAAGQEATVLCPADTPYAWTAGPIIFESDQGQSTVLPETRVYDADGQWIGISFTAPEAGSWWVDLSCQWRPIE
jgi:hypothetical protein